MKNKNQYHKNEVARIVKELNSLGSEFAPNGIVRYVLEERIKEEKIKEENNCDCAYCRTYNSKGI